MKYVWMYVHRTKFMIVMKNETVKVHHEILL